MSAILTLIGNVTRDPEQREVKGTKFTTFGVASNKKDGSDFYTVTLWGKQSDTAIQYVHKGMKVAVTGTFELRDYEKDGVKHQIPSLTANTLEFLSKAEGKKEITDEELPF